MVEAEPHSFPVAILECWRQQEVDQTRASWARQKSLSVSSLPSANQFAFEVETFAVDFPLKELYYTVMLHDLNDCNDLPVNSIFSS